MASSNSPLLSSSPSSIRDLPQWLDHITKTFQNHLLVDTNLPVCIFRLPETLTSNKPDSYIPQHIGLGPIHHFHTDLYNKQEQLKFITAKTILKAHKITSEFESNVIWSLKKFVPEARCCYDLYFDIDDDGLTWIFAIDGLFLLHVLSNVTGSSEYFEDVLMVENQIPRVILVQLLNSNSNADASNSFVSNLLVTFCEKRSPLKLATPSPITQLNLDINCSFHLLDCMYLLIVNHTVLAKNQFLRANLLVDVHLEDVQNAVQIAGGLFPGANAFLQPLLLVLKLPWDKVATLVKKLFGENPTALEIDIPSALKLSRIGKIEFRATPGGIRDIEFDEGKLTFSLPVLDLKSDSEVVLRNLVAYEGLMFKKGNITNLDFTEYVDIMCGIIDGVKDVKILRDRNIIEGDLGDDEIAKLFNGITKSSAKTDGKKSELQKTITKVNTHFGNIPRVKVYRFIKKLFLASWKIFAIVFSFLSLVLMIVAGACHVYECKGHFVVGNVRLLLVSATKNNQLVEF